MAAYLTTSWVDPRVTIARSVIEGTGLFATSSILEDERVVINGGRLVSDDELRVIIEGTTGTYSALAIADGSSLLQEDDDMGRYGNHSCDPNLWLADEVTLIARRDIAAGEELTTDYATMTAFEDWSMACHCGTEICRGVVTGADWRLPALRARYRGHFSPFLNERIASTPG
jgi:hypothetical protein